MLFRSRFCDVCKVRWGITPLQIFIYRDEGHYEMPDDETSWKPNYHTHIVWDRMNHNTGKSCKLLPQDMSEMQTIWAEALGMERGTSKELTGREHLERTDYIIAKQKQEAERAKAEKDAAKAERDVALREADKAKTEQEKLKAGNEEKERRSAELDSEIADKEERARKADRENTDNIKSGIANLLGKGKYAAIEKENAKLKAENERIRKAFPDAVKNKVEERTNGRIQVRILPNGQLGSENENMEQLMAGVISMTKVSAPGLATYNESYHTFGLPYIFDDTEDFYHVMDSGQMQDFFLSSSDDGFVTLTY